MSLSSQPQSSVIGRAVLRLETVDGTRLRFNARAGEHSFILDSGPEAEGPSPVQALQAALGACTGMDVISILRKKRQVVTGYEIEVLSERRMDEHPRIFTRLEVLHRVRGRGIDPKAVEEAVRLSDEKYCAVHAMLEKVVHVTSRIEVVEE
jgi:putative redox protein